MLQKSLYVSGSEVYTFSESHHDWTQNGDSSEVTEVMSEHTKKMIEQQNLINAFTKFYNDRKVWILSFFFYKVVSVSSIYDYFVFIIISTHASGLCTPVVV